MIIRMSQPWRHPKTGVWYYRGRIPTDLIGRITADQLSVELNGTLVTVKLGNIIKISLRTKGESEARVRHASVSAQIEKRWALARQVSTRTLSQREITGLSGLWYREMVADHEADPGDPFGWDVYQSSLIDALNCFDEPEDGVPPREAFNPAEGLCRLGKLFDVDEFLVRQNLSVDQASREKLTQEIV